MEHLADTPELARLIPDEALTLADMMRSALDRINTVHYAFGPDEDHNPLTDDMYLEIEDIGVEIRDLLRQRFA